MEIEIFTVAFSIASDFQYEKERKKGRTPMKVCLATVTMIYQLVLKQSPVKGWNSLLLNTDNGKTAPCEQVSMGDSKEAELRCF